MKSAGWVPGVLAASITASQYMLPQLLGNSTAAAIVALAIRVLTLGTVPEEQQPPLLLENELLLLLALLGLERRVLLVPRT